jgi:class 3 adenylate cyclase
MPGRDLDLILAEVRFAALGMQTPASIIAMLSGSVPESEDEPDIDPPAGNPGSRFATLSSKVAISWAGRKLEIQVGLSRGTTQGAGRRHRPLTPAGPRLADEGNAQIIPSCPLDSAGRTPRPCLPSHAGPVQIPAAVSAGIPPGTQTHPGPGGFLSSEIPCGSESNAVANFWSSLSPGERRAFRARADKRVFAAGARLMEEGEQANHVAVILEGCTEIRVRENGRERVVARRGPGQLLGERAALQVSVRSATVIATQPVDALVMHTEDFAAFISDNPGVLDLVESQIFSRMREWPAKWENQGTAAVTPGPGHPGRPAGPGPHREFLAGENCTILRTDVVAFSADKRNDEDRAIIRRATTDMTHLALGARRDVCWCEDRGDGHLIIAPPGIPTAEAITRLLTVLSRELKRHNRIYSEPIRVQLRLAVDVGPVIEDATGVSGRAIITASRMLDTPAFRQAITMDGAVLGLIVSRFVYESVIRQDGGFPEAAEYTEIPVEVKETRTSAWMRLIGSPGTAFPAWERLTHEPAAAGPPYPPFATRS